MPFFHKPFNFVTIIFLVLIGFLVFNKTLRQKYLKSSLKSYRLNPLILLSFIFLPIIMADQTGRLIKDLEIRDRPWVEQDINKVNCLVCEKNQENPNLYLKKGGSAHKSFPSNHAANSFAIAIIISFFFPKLRVGAYALAFTIAFSRIYIGVHYPFDVVYGMSIGILSSYLAKLLFTIYINKKLVR